MTDTDQRTIDEAQLTGILAQVAERDPDTRLVVVDGPASWAGPAVVDSNLGPVAVAVAASVLAAHTAIVAHADDRLALITPIPMGELGDEVAAAAWRGRAHRPSAWNAVRSLFKVEAIDPSLRGRQWMVEQLVASAPSHGYPQPPSQVLDLDTAWQRLLRGIGLPAQPDGRDVLAWALRPDARTALDRMDAEARTEIGAHLDHHATPAGSVILDVAVAAAGPDLVTWGLVADALWPEPDPVARTTFVERKFTPLRATLPGPAAEALGALAVDVVGDPGHLDIDVPATIQAAEQLLAEVDTEGTGDSAVLPGSFDRRIWRATEALSSAAHADGNQRTAALAGGRELVEAARAHRFAAATGGPRRIATLDALLRLARQDSGDARDQGLPDNDLAAQVAAYRDDGAWVDAAWHDVMGGDPKEGVAALQHDLAAPVVAWRQARDRQFAAAVAAGATNTPGAGSLAQQAPLRIEQVLDTVLAPLAARGPVLLLVIDGLSHAATPPILGDIAALGWRDVRPVDHPLPGVLAAIPSVTRVSRASLLSGRITAGTAPTEKEGFAAHVGLVEAGDGATPQLLHKKQLRTSAGVTVPARDTIADPDNHVIGVVFNGVDDFLGTDGQLQLMDGLAGLPGLEQVFDAAADAGRTVVLTSDHGHVLAPPGDQQQVISSAGGYGERYRIDDTPAGEGEVELVGSRVGQGDGRVVAAVDDGIRYTPAAKHGYHGGATPAEMLAPLHVLLPPGRELDGWVEHTVRAPTWWDPASAPVDMTDADESPVATTAPTRSRKVGEGQLSLLGDDSSQRGGPDWLRRLLDSPTMASQRARSGDRVTLDDDDLGLLLRVLVAGGGTVSGQALARTMDLPSSRVRSKLTAAQSLLNVDSFRVLSVESDGTAVLNVNLLAEQFGLDRASIGTSMSRPG